MYNRILDKKQDNKFRPVCREDKLLMYAHYLHQARQVADLPGKILLKKETRRVREKLRFLESLRGVERGITP